MYTKHALHELGVHTSDISADQKRQLNAQLMEATDPALALKLHHEMETVAILCGLA